MYVYVCTYIYVKYSLPPNVTYQTSVLLIPHVLRPNFAQKPDVCAYPDVWTVYSFWYIPAISFTISCIMIIAYLLPIGNQLHGNEFHRKRGLHFVRGIPHDLWGYRKNLTLPTSLEWWFVDMLKKTSLKWLHWLEVTASYSMVCSRFVFF